MNVEDANFLAKNRGKDPPSPWNVINQRSTSSVNVELLFVHVSILAR